MAQEKPEMMSQSAINATLQRFEPVICHGSTVQQMKAIYDCYQNLQVSDPQYAECHLADRQVMTAINVDKKEAQKLGKPDPYPNIPPFFETPARNQRTLQLMHLLESKGYTKSEKVSYLQESSSDFGRKIMKACNPHLYR